MGQVTPLPNKATVEALWSRYQAIVQRSRRNPMLSFSAEHQQAVSVAHERFERAFAAWVNG